MAPINVTTSKQQIQASVADDKVTATVSAGFGATGPQGASGVITASAPLVNSGTASAAQLSLSVGAGLQVSGGSLALASHTHTSADISDFTSAVIAAAPPTTNASLLTSGTLPDARLSANIARTSDVTTAVNAVIDAAPEALNTLNELAAALGDDANFASTVTNSLAGKVDSSDSRLSDSREWSADTVSQAEAEAGTATTRRAWTAQRVFQAIAAWWATVTVGTSKIDDGAVTSAKVAAGAVTPSKLAISSSQVWGVWGTLSVGAGDFQVHSAAPSFGLTRFHVSNSTGTVIAANGQFIINSTGAVTAGQWQGTAVAVAYGGTGATDAATARTNLGAASLSHTHIAADVTAGSTAGLVIVTTTGGALSALSQGTAGQVLKVNSTATGVEWGSADVDVLHDTVSATTYTGRAAPGSATSASVWKIRKTVYTGAGAVSSTATATNVKWDDRLTASYS